MRRLEIQFLGRAAKKAGALTSTGTQKYTGKEIVFNGNRGEHFQAGIKQYRENIGGGERDNETE